MNVLVNTPAVLSLGKLCDENGYSYEWINGQKPLLMKKRDSDTVQYGELRSYRGSRLVSEFVLRFLFFNISDTFKTGKWSSYIFLKLVYLPTTTVWSDSESREREDQSGIDSSPVPVSSSHVEDMMELWDPFFAANTGSAPKPTKNLKPNKEETTIERRDPLFASKPAPLGSEIHDRNPEYRDTREFFSWINFGAHEKCGFG